MFDRLASSSMTILLALLLHSSCTPARGSGGRRVIDDGEAAGSDSSPVTRDPNQPTAGDDAADDGGVPVAPDGG